MSNLPRVRALALVGCVACASACGGVEGRGETSGPPAASAVDPPGATAPEPVAATPAEPAAPEAPMTTTPACAAPSDVVPRLVLAAAGSVVALDLGTLALAGSLAGSYRSIATGCGLYALDYDGGVVAKLDPHAPWKRVASYDAGRFVEHFATTPTKGYAVAGGSTAVAVFDLTKTTEHVAPTKIVTLSPTDAPVMAAVAVPEKNRVFFLHRLGGTLPDCGPGHGWVTAIDTTTDTVAPIGGSAIPLALDGANPGSIAYDAKRDRLLVHSLGCIAEQPDQSMRLGHDEIESIDLASGARETITSFDGPWGGPQTVELVYGDATHALVLRDTDLCVYDPSSGSTGTCAPPSAAEHPYIEQVLWDPFGARFLAVATALDPPPSGRGVTHVLSRSLVAVDASTGAPTVLPAPAPFSSSPLPDEPIDGITGAAIWPAR